MADLAHLNQRGGLWIRRSTAVNGVFALLFAMAMLVPDWPQLFYAIYGVPMTDRAVYERLLRTYQLSTDYFQYFSPITYFTREWLWNTSIAFAHRTIGLPIEVIFGAISIFVLSRLAYAVGSKCGWTYSLLLVNPLVIDFAFSQLRLALAMAVLSFFWEGKRPLYLTIIAYVFCTSIHTAVVAFAAMHLAAHLFNRSDIRHLAGLIGTGFIISIVLGPLREPILSLLGDRRAEYPDMSSTLLYLSFWIVAWAALLIDWRQSMKSLDARYAIVILSLVFVNVFHDGYSTRFIVAAFPSLMIAFARWQPKSTNYLILVFVLYSAVQWFYWLRLA